MRVRRRAGLAAWFEGAPLVRWSSLVQQSSEQPCPSESLGRRHDCRASQYRFTRRFRQYYPNGAVTQSLEKYTIFVGGCNDNVT
jgi:hypothetical protein